MFNPRLRPRNLRNRCCPRRLRRYNRNYRLRYSCRIRPRNRHRYCRLRAE